MRERADAVRRSGSCCARGRGPKVTMLEKRTAAGLAQQKTRKAKLGRGKARKARCEGHRSRAHRRAAACRALLI
eukprot:5966871-Pleurochrysis_carterae.AAC.2